MFAELRILSDTFSPPTPIITESGKCFVSLRFHGFHNNKSFPLHFIHFILAHFYSYLDRGISPFVSKVPLPSIGELTNMTGQVTT